MKNKSVRFSVVGCGDIAVPEIKAVRSTSEGEVALVMDVNPVYAEAIGREFGIAYTDTYEDVLNSDVDVVILAVPHHLHREMAVSAANAGKHVILEKPIATTIRDAERIMEACRANNVRLSVAYVLRFRPTVVRVRELLHRGAIGTPFHVQSMDLFEKPDTYWTGGYSLRASTDWRASKAKSGGGVLLMNGSHTIDYLIDLLAARPESVYGTADNRATPGVEVEDHATATIRFGGGAVGVFSACTVAAGNLETADVIVGTEGTITIGERPRVFLKRPWENLTAGKWIDIPVEETHPWQDGRNELFRRFSESVLCGTDAPISGEAALTTLKAVLGAYRSARTGKVVSI